MKIEALQPARLDETRRVVAELFPWEDEHQMAVSAALIGFGLAAAYQVGIGRFPRVGLIRGAGAVAGGLLVVGSFTANAPALIDGGLPGWFPWPLFVAGIALASWSTVASLRAGSAGTAEAPERGAPAPPLSRGLERNA